ncbi:hypothetical protein EJ110_NYTH08213 [Nymphaea thermarum]|nr:hypothetical protein EJ110_NYTH08213 [Nymphaea thermarum]
MEQFDTFRRYLIIALALAFLAVYRVSPFANTRARHNNNFDSRSNSSPELTDVDELKRRHRWSPVIDAAKWRKKTFFQHMELCQTLHGFIVFEVAWKDVCGINYLNELQTDTSLALEVKHMKKWEFNTVEQASSCISLWFSGTDSEIRSFVFNLDLLSSRDSCLGCRSPNAGSPCSLAGVRPSMCSLIEDIALEHFTSTPKSANETQRFNASDCTENNILAKQRSAGCIADHITQSSGEISDIDSVQKSVGFKKLFGVEPIESSTVLDATQYGNSLLQFRFNDRDLPFKLNEIITPNLRLLTLLEFGLPSWVLFFQSYPVFVRIYRPWMKPLVRILYVVASIVTVLIASYDLYKNVPVFRATAVLLFKPLFDWIESWDMISRIKYVATMLFLHHLGKVIERILSTWNSVRPFVSSLTKPFLEPLFEAAEFLLPFWSTFIGTLEDTCSSIWMALEATYVAAVDLVELVLWPVQSLLSMIWTIASSFVYPLFYSLWEVLTTPIRILLALVNYAMSLLSNLFELLVDSWQLASSTSAVIEAKAAAEEVSILKSFWNVLYSQIFRAVRSILNGLVAFCVSCNRHRLSSRPEEKLLWVT